VDCRRIPHSGERGYEELARNGVIRALIVAIVARRWIAGEFRVLENAATKSWRETTSFAHLS
jgi:hypothetical protein